MNPAPTGTPATTGTTVEYQVRFATAPKGRKRVREAGEPFAKAVTAPTAPPLPPRIPESVAIRPIATTPDAVVPEQPDSRAAAARRVPKIALLLVLGHHFERLVRDGVVKDYAEIARQTGLTRARVTQIVNLTLLAPGIQEEILSGTGDSVAAVERNLRDLVATCAWLSQLRQFSRS